MAANQSNVLLYLLALGALCGCGGGREDESANPTAYAHAPSLRVAGAPKKTVPHFPRLGAGYADQPAPSAPPPAPEQTPQNPPVTTPSAPSPLSMPLAPASPDSAWYKVAEEGEKYAAQGQANVRFGVPGSWIYALMDGSFVCSSTSFGAPPAVTMRRQCQTDSAIESNRMVKVMPLGDSITAAYGYKEELWRLIQAAGLKRTDFVGNAPYQYTTGDIDPDNNGYGGYVASYLLRAAGTGSPKDAYFTDERDLETWFQGQAPDIVILHIGTNDAWGAADADTVLAAYTKLLKTMRGKNPRVTLVVSQLIPMAVPGCDYCEASIQKINAAIPPWAQLNSTPESQVLVVDQHSSFDPATQSKDGVHPNEAGAAQMAARYFALIGKYLR